MSGYADYNGLDLDSTKVIPIPLILATEDSVKGYGNFVFDYEEENVQIVPWKVEGSRPLCVGTGVGGGYVEGNFLFRWEGTQCLAINEAVQGNYVIGVTVDDRRSILTREANYHPDGGQVVFPSSRDQLHPFVLLLAKAPDGRTIDDVVPSDFKAFYFDGSAGFQIAPSVWHQPAFPVGASMKLLNKQGAVHACVAIDFVNEFGALLQVPLNLMTDEK